MTRRVPATAAVLPLLLGGCAYQHYQSDFGAASVEDHQFLTLFAIFLIVCTVMYVIVAAVLLAALWRRRRSSLTVDDRRHHQTSPMVRPALIAWRRGLGQQRPR